MHGLRLQQRQPPRSHRFGIVHGLPFAMLAAFAVAKSDPAPDRSIENAARSLLAQSDPRRPILVGEIHGTQEVPALLAAVLRQGGGKSWLLGLEIPRQEQVRIDAFLRSDGSEKARDVLLAGEFWTRASQDGRSSRAMLQLIDAVRRLRRNDRDIRIVCFDDLAPTDGGRDRDAQMADALRAAVRAEKHRRVIVLTGNYHARIGRGAPWNARQEFMGWHLRDLSPLSIDVGAPTGSSWVCNPDCGVYTFGTDRAPGDGLLHMSKQTDVNGYHGMLKLPHFTASPPAVESGKPQSESSWRP